LKKYDYTQAGVYYVTVCVKDRVCLFGNVINGQMQLNHAGRIVADAWNDLPNHYADVTLDAFVVMPNHVHGVIIITDPIGAGFKPAPMITTPTLKPAPTTTSSSYTNDKPRPYETPWFAGNHTRI
jgi:hypothetical protein